MFPFARYVHLFPPSLRWVPWPLFTEPCGSPPSSVLRGRKTAPPSLGGHLWFPLASTLPFLRAETVSSPGFMGNPFGSMPRARDSGDPGATLHSGRPDAAFRLVNGVSVTTCRISELNLHGLLPRCVRFAPTSRPVNGNTHYRPACSLWPGGTYTRWIPLRSFTVSSSVPPLPRFSQRDNNVGSPTRVDFGCLTTTGSGERSRT